MAFCGYLKQSTAVDIMLGPFVDEDDGKTAETGLTISQADVRLSKNGGNMAQKNDSAACSHDEIGIYKCDLDATDTATLGLLDVMVHESGALPVHQTYQVVEENWWDTMCGSDYLEVDAMQVEGGDATDAINAACDTALTDYDGPTDAEMDAAFGALNDISEAEVNAQVDAAIEDYHLDHLLAATYDPSSKPGAEDALLNELVENDSGVSRFTENALEQAPSGTGASASAIADAVWDEDITGHTDADSAGEALGNAGSGASAADIVDEWETQSQADPTGFHVNVMEINGTAQTANDVGGDVDDILTDTNELQGDWTDAGRLDALIDAIKAKTDNLPADPADDSDIDSQLSTIDTVVDAIKAVTDNLPDSGALSDLAAILTDTNELQADWTNTGRLDTIIDAIKAKTDNLPTDPADDSDIDSQLSTIDTVVDAIKAVTDTLTTSAIADAIWDEAQSGHVSAGTFGEIATEIASILSDTGTDGVVIATATAQAIADELLKRGVDNVEDAADVNSIGALVLACFHSAISGSTWTIKKTDDSTTFDTRAITTSGGMDPISSVAA